MADSMEPLVMFLVMLMRMIFVTIISCIKACLPNGILPRKSVRGDTVLITGSGSGLGRLMAIEFAKLGANIVLWDINEVGNNETKTKCLEHGVQVDAYTVDLSQRDAVNATARKVKRDVGKVDILINNAGIVTGKKIFDCPDELMEKTMAVNTNANFFTTKNFVPDMISNNKGHLVTIASIAGKLGSAGLVDYCASKYAAVGFHESLAAELRKKGAHGVKTTIVCPYFINTGMFDGVQTKSPMLLPMLEPEYVVECIMEAVLTDREELQLPRFAYFSCILANILPTEAKMILGEYFGVFEIMDNFVGRK